MTSPKGLIPPSQIPPSQNKFDGPSCRNKRRIEKTGVELQLPDLQQPELQLTNTSKRTANSVLQAPKNRKQGRNIHPDYEKNNVFVDGRLCYIGKDGTKWEGSPNIINTGTRNKNIVTQLPKVKAPLRSVTNCLDVWKGFFTNDMVDLIVTCTNREISRVRNNYIRTTLCSTYK